MKLPNSFAASLPIQAALLNGALMGIRFLDTLSPSEFIDACYHEGAQEGARVRGILRSHLGHLYEEVKVDLGVCWIEIRTSLLKEVPRIGRENATRLRRWIYWKLEGKRWNP